MPPRRTRAEIEDDLIGGPITTAAFEGDPRELLQRLRDPTVTLTMRERRYLANEYEGKVGRPSHRMPTTRTIRTYRRIAIAYANMRESTDFKNALPDLAEREKVSVATVKRAITWWNGRGRDEQSLWRWLAKHGHVAKAH